MGLPRVDDGLDPRRIEENLDSGRVEEPRPEIGLLLLRHLLIEERHNLLAGLGFVRRELGPILIDHLLDLRFARFGDLAADFALEIGLGAHLFGGGGLFHEFVEDHEPKLLVLGLVDLLIQTDQLATGLFLDLGHGDHGVTEPGRHGTCLMYSALQVTERRPPERPSSRLQRALHE